MFGIAPAIAPIIGGWILLSGAGWPLIFWFLVVFALVLLELIAMYLQARNASETEMDKRLGVASHRNKDDVAK